MNSWFIYLEFKLNTVKAVLRCQEVTFGTKAKWPDKTGDLIKEVQVIWDFQ